jgi:hypothetical protein
MRPSLKVASARGGNEKGLWGSGKGGPLPLKEGRSQARVWCRSGSSHFALRRPVRLRARSRVRRSAVRFFAAASEAFFARAERSSGVMFFAAVLKDIRPQWYILARSGFVSASERGGCAEFAGENLIDRSAHAIVRHAGA